jgi:hypothetical protein
MPLFLRLHPLHTDSVQSLFRDTYPLREVNYELTRNVSGHRDNFISELKGGKITAVLDGFGDENLFRLLFSHDIVETGEVVSIDIQERVIDKFRFSRAKFLGYRLNFDASSKEEITTTLTIEAKEISSDNDLFFEK